MACVSSSRRLCARAPEKLCQLLVVKNNNSSSYTVRQLSSSGATGAVVVCGGRYAGALSHPAVARKYSSSKVSVASLRGGGVYFVPPWLRGGTSAFFYNPDPGSPAGRLLQLNGFQTVRRNLSTTSWNESENNSNHNTKSVLPVISSEYSCTKSCTNNTSQSSCIRRYSSVHTQQPAGPVREIQVDPYLLLEDDLKDIYDDIRKVLLKASSQMELKTISSYYFDGQGKALRPMVVMLMARAVNYHMNIESRNLLERQRQIAIFAEMVHSASLVHDDVIDNSDFRRGKPSVNVLFNHKRVTMAGDYILAIASIVIAGLKNDDVTIILCKILTDLVQGEFMQLGSKETENERFAHYLTKTYRKTASLIANTLKGAAVLAGAEEPLSELAFQYGRNIGLAFQLVDDLLDFVSSAEQMGKPTAADLKLGLATAPVLFACEKFPELNPMIMRRFQEPGDVERAFELVHKSHGLEQTRFLARKHCIEAIRLAQEMAESPYQKALCVVSDLVINRLK